MKTHRPKSLANLKLALIIFMCANPVLAFTQDIASANLTWEADQATDVQTQSTIAYKATFKTNGTQSVEWIQKKGQSTATYTVTGTEGQWTDVSTSGSFTFLLGRNGKNSKMIVEKNASGTFITMDFSKVGEFTSKQRFRIQSVQRTK